MFDRSMVKNFSVLILLIAALTAGCAKSAKIQCLWMDKDIRIDGSGEDWSGCSIHYDEKSRSTVCVYNDDRHLYLRFSSGSRETMKRITASGLTVWLDPKGGKKKILGVRFSVRDRSGAPPLEHGLKNQGPGPGASKKPPQSGRAELEILGPEEDQVRSMSLEDARCMEGVNVGAGIRADVLTCELKISLSRLADLGMTSHVGIGFLSEMPSFRTPKGVPGSIAGGMGGGRGGGMGGGGMGGGRGGGMPGGVGKGGPSGASSLEDLDFWVKTKLAKK